jgi:PAS domain S-box-containing protein
MSTVLVVDDQTSNRELVRDILTHHGHRVIEAHEGAEALGLAHDQHPDLVLTDVMMPGMDGYQLAQELRAASDTAGTPIVFLTANYLPAEAAPFADACGVARVLLKSIAPQSLLRIIEEVIAEEPAAHPGPEPAIDTAEASRAHVRAISAKLIQRDAALIGAETRFRLVADKSPVGIVFGDRYGSADYVNDRFATIMGVPAGHLLGLGWLLCTAEDQHDGLLAIVRGAGEGAQHRYRGQVMMPDGTLHWLNVNLQAVRNADEGAFDGFITTIDDVTAVVEAEQRHRAAERQHDIDARIRATERLESLSRLAGGVAHDFNNILGAILGFEAFVSEAIAELAGAGRPVDPETGRALLADLEQIRLGGKRATDLTQQLLTFGSRKVLTLAPLDLNQAVRESRDLLARTTGDGVTIVLREAPDLPPILAEPINIGQILLNLTLNARDAMPNGGTLTVVTAPVSLSNGQAGGSGRQPGRYVRLTVSDTGEGMPPDVLNRALEPFFTTKPHGQGSGLGLATVYGIVNQLGGTLGIESTPGAGTVITVDLPATDRAVAAPPPEPVAAGGGTETILLADDEGPLRETVCRSLVKAGYTVLTAAGGLAAIAVAAGHAGRIDLLLSDVMMPGMLGHELAAQLQHSRPETPVLLMSGYAGGLMDNHGALPPGVTVLPKPFSEHELLLAVRAGLGVTAC